MGLFLLHEGIHARFGSHRSKFFWEGTGAKRKYHLVNWPTVCRPKAMRGLGLLNTRKMNIALLLKWVWKLYNEDDTIWSKIIKAKYPDASDLFTGSGHGGSHFWKSIHKIKHYFKLGAKHAVGDGRRTRFWSDWWLGREPLKDSFPYLFSVCEDTNQSVASVCAPGGPHIRFRRSLD
jgi:hypothetical protein